MDAIVILLLIVVSWLVVQLLYAWRYGDSITSPLIKICYVIETEKEAAHGAGLLSVPELECLPYYYGRIIFKERTTLAKVKWYAIKLRMRKPNKHYKVCYHY